MKRRLNLAAAIVHDPPLVMLDEPTVGVDPQSRNALYDIVRGMRASGRTVLYTTHYMEEAERLCDRVGIIDRGKLLALDTVDRLIAAHGGTSVVIVQREGTDGVPNEERIPTADPVAIVSRELAATGSRAQARGLRIERPDLEACLPQSDRPHAPRLAKGISMAAVIALALKDLRLLARDRVDLFFTFVFPLFIAIFFGTIFGGGGGSKMEIAVIDEDGSAGSAAFVQRLEKSDEFDVRRNLMEKDRPERPLTRAEGEDLVRRGKVVASVVLPKGFGSSSDNIFRGDPITLEGSVDPSHKAEAGMLQGILTKYAFQGMAEMFGDPAKMRGMARKNLDDLRASTGMDPAMKSALETFLPSVERFFTDAPAGDGSAPDKPGTGLAGFEPVKIDLKELAARQELPNNPYALTFPQAIVWGVLGCVVSFAISLTAERSGGTLVRLMLAPISRWQIPRRQGIGLFLDHPRRRHRCHAAGLPCLRGGAGQHPAPPGGHPVHRPGVRRRHDARRHRQQDGRGLVRARPRGTPDACHDRWRLHSALPDAPVDEDGQLHQSLQMGDRGP
jgi:hypothetical protein